MNLDELLVLLKSFRVKVASLNPFKLVLEDLNPQDNVNMSGTIDIDVVNKKLNIHFDVEVKA